jgi:putative membrane protein
MMNMKTYLAGAVMAVGLTVAGSAFAMDDAEFLKTAIMGDNSEIALGQLAADKSESQDVKEFGNMLVTDHSKAKEEASQMAEQMNVEVPAEPTPEAQQEMDKLKGMSGDGFDKEFASFMVMDHKKMISMFEDQAKSDAKTADMAEKTLPVLKKHLETAQQLSGG